MFRPPSRTGSTISPFDHVKQASAEATQHWANSGSFALLERHGECLAGVSKGHLAGHHLGEGKKNAGWPTDSDWGPGQRRGLFGGQGPSAARDHRKTIWKERKMGFKGTTLSECLHPGSRAGISSQETTMRKSRRARVRGGRQKKTMRKDNPQGALCTQPYLKGSASKNKQHGTAIVGYN